MNSSAISNPSLSISEKCAKHLEIIIQLFNKRKFNETLLKIKELPNKNFLTNLISSRCFYHIKDINGSQSILTKILHELTSLIKLEILLPDEENDNFINFINKLNNIINKIEEFTNIYLKNYKYLDEILFIKAIIEYRCYEYERIDTYLEKCFTKLEKLNNERKFTNFDFLTIYAEACFKKGNISQSLTLALKAERSIEIENNFGLIDHFLFEPNQIIYELLFKLKLSEYLQKRMVERVHDLDEKFIKEIRLINVKYNNIDKSYYKLFLEREDFLKSLQITVFRNYDCKFVSNFLQLGLYQFSEILCNHLLNNNNLDEYVKFLLITGIIESQYKRNKFIDCLSTFMKYEQVIVKNQNETKCLQRVILIYSFIIHAYTICKLNQIDNIPITLTKVNQLFEHNISSKNLNDELKKCLMFIGSKLYLISNKIEMSDKLMEKFISFFETNEEEFVDNVVDYLERDIVLCEEPEQEEEVQEDTNTYSKFEDFSPARLKAKKRRESSAMEELKRKREAALEQKKKVRTFK
ncbi:hypothetical protein ABK040_000652 [Willaertia magna]